MKEDYYPKRNRTADVVRAGIDCVNNYLNDVFFLCELPKIRCEEYIESNKIHWKIEDKNKENLNEKTKESFLKVAGLDDKISYTENEGSIVLTFNSKGIHITNSKTNLLNNISAILSPDKSIENPSARTLNYHSRQL